MNAREAYKMATKIANSISEDAQKDLDRIFESIKDKASLGEFVVDYWVKEESLSCNDIKRVIRELTSKGYTVYDSPYRHGLVQLQIHWSDPKIKKGIFSRWGSE